MRSIIAYLKRQAFLPGYLGVLTNPSYIIRSRLLSALRRSAPSVAGHVLDFGCGSKPYQSLFYRADAYIGVDILESGHSHSNSLIDVYYNGHSLPFANESFDAVVSFEVFEHVFNLGEMLAEIKRVLKPGGKLLFTVPFAWHEHEQPYDFARYTSFGLSAVLKNAGFNVVQIEKTGHYFLAVAQLSLSYIHLSISRLPWVVTILLRLIILFPMTFISLLLGRLLPQRSELFCNMVVLATKGT